MYVYYNARVTSIGKDTILEFWVNGFRLLIIVRPPCTLYFWQKLRALSRPRFRIYLFSHASLAPDLLWSGVHLATVRRKCTPISHTIARTTLLSMKIKVFDLQTMWCAYVLWKKKNALFRNREIIFNLLYRCVEHGVRTNRPLLHRPPKWVIYRVTNSKQCFWDALFSDTTRS